MRKKQGAIAKWLGIPYDDEGMVEPISYHFSIVKDMFWVLHEEFGGHDESIFNC